MTNKNYRTELIQVAAVAVAIVDDLDYGSAKVGTTTSARTLIEVFRERHRQNEKWGAQHHDPLTWLLILMEEVGEVAEEITLPADRYAVKANIHSLIVRAGLMSKEWLEAK
jgi:hypothetical protein